MEEKEKEKEKEEEEVGLYSKWSRVDLKIGTSPVFIMKEYDYRCVMVLILL